MKFRKNGTSMWSSPSTVPEPRMNWSKAITVAISVLLVCYRTSWWSETCTPFVNTRLHQGNYSWSFTTEGNMALIFTKWRGQQVSLNPLPEDTPLSTNCSHTLNNSYVGRLHIRNKMINELWDKSPRNRSDLWDKASIIMTTRLYYSYCHPCKFCYPSK